MSVQNQNSEYSGTSCRNMVCLRRYQCILSLKTSCRTFYSRLRKGESYCQHLINIISHYHGRRGMGSLESHLRERHLLMRYKNLVKTYHHLLSMIHKLNVQSCLESQSTNICCLTMSIVKLKSVIS